MLGCKWVRGNLIFYLWTMWMHRFMNVFWLNNMNSCFNAFDTEHCFWKKFKIVKLLSIFKPNYIENIKKQLQIQLKIHNTNFMFVKILKSYLNAIKRNGITNWNRQTSQNKSIKLTDVSQKTVLLPSKLNNNPPTSTSFSRELNK